MADRYHFVQADEKVRLVVNCVDIDSTPLDLTGAAANLRWKTVDGTIENREMELTDEINGVASYTFLTDELVPPTMEYEVTVTKPDGTIITSLTSEILGVRARLA